MGLRAKKLRFPRMFRSSFAASCSTRTVAQVVHRSVLIPRPSSPRDSTRTIFSDSDGPRFPRRTSSERYPPSVLRDDDYLGRRCPPSMPITPFMRRLPQPPVPSPVENNSRRGLVQRRRRRRERLAPSTSRSLSPDSSETRRRRRGRAAGSGALPLAGGGIKDSFAVVKRSSDPRGDFRRSMVEMIVEKEMFGAEELQKLLECFLALNSHHHHRVILLAFAEIWEALFSSRS
ncbi:transcription repressor OFP8-like [Rhodamnia argentea]|uniref:Transcription repressor n=1 Tax=Rhodamnia argentea TaxID=178133 RepID=A0ABM3HBN6_9MYRT|nr:transcription repressor OFP8-like [Rhodamnia argentea]